MKWEEIKDIPSRMKALITRTFVWKDDETGDISVHKYTFRVAWKLAGPRSWSWWWVVKYGTLSCRCVRNPITRRMVMYFGDCSKHGLRFRHETSREQNL